MAPNDPTPKTPRFVNAKHHPVIRVGGGRGFIVAGEWGFLVITAAHCLPSMPVNDGFAMLEATYASLLGPLGGDGAGLSVDAECQFVDPIADIAVLGKPDGQVVPNEAEAYEMLTHAAAPAMGVADSKPGDPAWILPFAGPPWVRTTTTHRGGELMLGTAEAKTLPGMSGSPVVDEKGRAIGIIALGKGGSGAPNPRLAYHLPVGLWRELRRESR